MLVVLYFKSLLCVYQKKTIKCTRRGLNPRPQRHKLRALTDCATRAHHII